MQTADIAKSTQCWCERIWAADLARSAPLPLMPFSARSAPFSAPLTLRSHTLIVICDYDVKNDHCALDNRAIVKMFEWQFHFARFAASNRRCVWTEWKDAENLANETHSIVHEQINGGVGVGWGVISAISHSIVIRVMWISKRRGFSERDGACWDDSRLARVLLVILAMMPTSVQCRVKVVAVKHGLSMTLVCLSVCHVA